MDTSPSRPTKPSRPSRLAGLRGLGRGLVLGSSVAVLGLGTLSAADASAAGIAHGVRYAATSNPIADKPAPTDLPSTSTQVVVRRRGTLRG